MASTNRGLRGSGSGSPIRASRRGPGGIGRLAASLGIAVAWLAAAGPLLAFGPSNDLFDYAETLTGASGRAEAWTAGATKEEGEPAHAGQPGGASVWYLWTPASSGTAVFQTNGSNYDTLLAVYTGRRVNRLSFVAADDDGAGSEIGTSRVAFAATAGTTYAIAVDAKAGVTAQSAKLFLHWNRPIPANDNLRSATPISGLSGTITGTNAWATAEPGESDPNSSESPLSVWYRWTAPVTGQFAFDTAGSTADLKLGAYTGATLGELSLIAENNDAAYRDSPTARTVFSATSGVTYRIRLDRELSSGAFTLNWQQIAAPGNDAFAAAAAMSGHTGTATGTTIGATLEAGESSHAGISSEAGRTIWYRWTAPATGDVVVSTDGSAVSTVLAAYTGGSIGTLTKVASHYDQGNDASLWIEAVKGRTYSFVVDAMGGMVGDIRLNWRWQAPQNDDVEAHKILMGDPATVVGNNLTATAQTGEPAHAGQTARRSIWYGYIAYFDGSLVLDTTGSDFDTVLAVYEGESIGALVPVAANDDNGAAKTSRLSIAAKAGRTYAIAVDGKSGAVGTSNLRWTFSAAPPANDAFGNAQALSGVEGTVSGRTLAATKEAGEPAHAGSAGGRSIWYRWTAPASGRAMFMTGPRDWFTTTVDTLLAVYTGSSVSGLTPVAASNDYPLASGSSRVHFPVTRGVTYRIAVDAVAAAEGNVVLRWTTPPLNDELADALPIGGRSGSELGTTLRATTQAWENGAPAGGGPGGSVWYRWTAPSSEVIEFTADASTFAPSIVVYTGSTLMDKLTRIPLVGEATSDERIKVRFYARAGTIYRIALGADYWGAFKLDWRPAASPANDNFSRATPLAGETGTFRQGTVGATNESGEPMHDPEYGGSRTVWYTWKAPRTMTLSIDTRGSDFPTVIAAYEGTDLGSVRQLVAYHNGVDPRASRIRFGATAGVTYRIAVGGAGGYSGVPGGSLVLNWRAATAPANDALALGRVLTGAAGRVSATNDEASRERGEPIHAVRLGGASVWFRWTAPADGPVSFDTFGTSLDTRLAVYLGSSVGALTLVRQNDNAAFGVEQSRVAFVAVAGTTYQVALDTAFAHYFDIAGNTGTLSLGWSQPPRPVNDQFELAAPFGYEGSGYRLLLDEDDNRGASRQTGEPLHAGVAGGRSIWYRWTAPTSDRFAIHTRGSGFDTLLAVYTGSAVTALTPVAADDDSGGAGASRVEFDTVDGRTYLIAVDGKGGAVGDLTMSLNLALVADNDSFPAAQTITGASGAVEGDNGAASFQALEPHHALWGPEQSVWYRWKAPSTGTYRFIASGRFSSLLAIYTGSRLSDLVPLADTEGTTVRIGAVAGTTYHIAVDAFEDGGPFTLSWGVVAAPVNDNQVAATSLSGSAGQVTGTTVGASRQAGEPAHAGRRGTASVWYRWVAPASGTLTVDTAGSAFDTLLGVYTGSGLGSLTQRAANDDTGTVRTSRVRLPVSSGTTYWFALDGLNATSFWYGGAAGSLALAWQLIVPPANDPIASATGLSGVAGTIAGSNAGARLEPGEPAHGTRAGGASVWYRWTAPIKGTVTFDGRGSTIPVLLAVYQGTGVDSLTVVRRSDDTSRDSEFVTFPAASGATYLIAVDGASPTTGAINLAWSMAPPSNDPFAGAAAVSGRTGEWRGSTFAASRETGEPTHAGVVGARSVWFRWTAPETESMTVSTAGSGFDTLLAVYTGTSVTGLTTVASNDNAAGLTTSQLTFEAIAGRVYQVAVDGRGSASGAVALSWRPTPDPPNNQFSEARPIEGRSGGVPGTTFAANRQSGEPDHAGAGGRHSVWYRWTAPASGPVTLWTEYIWFDSVLAVYRGTGLSSLTLVAADDDSGGNDRSRLTFSATSGTTYLVAVDGVADGQGDFTLNWNLPPLNDAFAAAIGLSGPNGSVTGDLVAATAEPGEPDHTSWGPRHSIWYRWTAPASGAVAFSVTTPAADLDPWVAVYVGSELASLTPAGGGPDGIRIPVFAGTTYRIALDGLTPAGVTLSWAPTSAPANDNFGAAVPLPGDAGSTTGSVVGATHEIGEPWHWHGHGQGVSVWYRWTAPSSGEVAIDTLGSEAFWTVIAVYEGTTVGALTEVAANSGYWGDEASFVRFAVVAGREYRIAIDSSGGTGPFTLNWMRPEG